MRSLYVILPSCLFAVLDNMSSLHSLPRGTKFAGKSKKKLGLIISRFENLEALIFRACMLRRLDNFVLPRLLHCDLRNNDISEVHTVLSMLSTCRRIDSLDLRGNPVEEKVRMRSDCTSHCKWGQQSLPVIQYTT